MTTFAIILVSVIGVSIPPACFYLGRLYERRDTPSVSNAIDPAHEGANGEWAEILHGLRKDPEIVVETTTEPEPTPDYLAEIVSLREAIDQTMAEVWADVRAINTPSKRTKRKTARSCHWYAEGLPEVGTPEWQTRVKKVRINA